MASKTTMHSTAQPTSTHTTKVMPSSTHTTKPVMKGGAGNCSGSGWAWQMSNVGDLTQQSDRTFDSSIGNSATQMSNAISTIQNPNAANNWSNMSGGRRRKRGGNLLPIIYEAATPGILLAAQNMYRPKHKTNKKHRTIRRRKNVRFTRGGDFTSMMGQAAAPAILLAAQNMYKPKHKMMGSRRKTRSFKKSYTKKYRK